MVYEVKVAEREDLPEILSVYAGARAFMASRGNPGQWGNSNPPEKTIRENIRDRNLYVLTKDGKIHGVFFFDIFEDPMYRVMEQGSWRSSRPYGVLHRVAGDGSGGIVAAAVSFARQHADHLRIDTHRDNLPMQRAILRQEFQQRGIVYTESGSPRIAYDWLKNL